MKRSDNLSKKTTVSTSSSTRSSSSTKSAAPSKRKSSGSGSGKGSVSKKKTVPRSSKPAGLSLSPVTALKSGKKPSHSNRNIGVKASGKMVKTLYALTEGKEGAEEHAALKAGLKQIQNLVNKRINKLVQLEAETGVTSPALKKLRETGYAKGVSVKGYGTDTDTLRDHYKAMLEFLKDKTSTREGVTRNMLEIEKELKEAGWRPVGKDTDNLTVHLTAEQYEKFKRLSEYFYSEQNKYKFYMNSDNHDQEELRDAINKEITRLMDQGDLDTVMMMAEERMEEIYMQGVKELFD